MTLRAAIALLVLAAVDDARAQPSHMERCAALIVDARGMRESGVGRIVSVQRGEGRLILAGVEHSFDPRHPQFDALATLFWESDPTVVFYEGEGQDAPTRTAYQAIGDSGEPGLLRYLARQAGVPAFRASRSGPRSTGSCCALSAPSGCRCFSCCGARATSQPIAASVGNR